MKSKIIELIKNSNKLALFHHINPDGDTLSSSYGLALALQSKFPDKQIKVLANKEELFNRFPFLDFNEELFIDSIDNTWTTIIGDTSVYSRIDRIEEFKKGAIKICFDHHQNNSDDQFDAYWREPDWIASSIQAVEIAKELKVEFNEEIAFFLSIGILTDSGNFAFSLGDSLPVKTYAFLLEFISDERMDNFFKGLKQRKKQDLEIEKFMFNNIEYVGNVVVLKVKDSNLNDLGIEEKDIKMKVNRLGNIEGYPVWSMFIEMKNEEETYIKGSLRSNGPKVSDIATKFNGGGHVRAAGVKVNSWEQVDEIVSIINESI